MNRVNCVHRVCIGGSEVSHVTYGRGQWELACRVYFSAYHALLLLPDREGSGNICIKWVYTADKVRVSTSFLQIL